jgi:hypothetical protein
MAMTPVSKFSGPRLAKYQKSTISLPVTLVKISRIQRQDFTTNPAI